MIQYKSTFSPFRRFSCEEWATFQSQSMLSISDIDLSKLKAMNEPLNLEEIEKIYVPMVKLLQIYNANYQKLHTERDKFFLQKSRCVPYIIGIAGSVAAGKSTTARVLRKLLSMTSEKLKVDLITTDGFLYSNRELEKRGILDRKGFPESYDAKKIISFLSAIKSGQINLKVPQYSHLYYDVIIDKYLEIGQPDILIVEGINVLQVAGNKHKRKVFVSDFFDFSIYVDANERDLEQWYVDRFLKLQDTAFRNPKSYFHKYRNLSKEESEKLARDIWNRINLPNLRQNILPTRLRADLIIEKNSEHKIRSVRIRKI